MEVLQRPNYATSVLMPAMHKLLSPQDGFHYCAYEANTPSRTPTPERQSARPGVMVDISVHSNVLKKCLRGEIPANYSHLASRLSPHVPSSYSPSPSGSALFSSPAHYMEVDNGAPHSMYHHTPSPCPSNASSSSYSPRPSSNASQDSDFQTEPIDLSCKRSPRKRTATSAFSDSDKRSSPVLSSSLPAKLSPSSDYHLNPQPCSPPLHSFPPSPCEGQNGEAFSLLRNLLSVGKHFQGSNSSSATSASLSSSAPNLSSDRNCESPDCRKVPVPGNTKVRLAKKNQLVVEAKVKNLMVKIVQFTKSIPEFQLQSPSDQFTLLLNSWSKIMLLYMAETNLCFTVTPIHSVESTINNDINSSSQDEPIQKSVEAMQTFIRKCHQMGVDSQEYEYLRMLVLFNSGYVGLSRPEVIDQVNSVVQQLLQQYIKDKRNNDVMHYSRLLMCLPSLYGINSKMFENLFCKHMKKADDIEVLLKELITKLS